MINIDNSHIRAMVMWFVGRFPTFANDIKSEAEYEYQRTSSLEDKHRYVCVRGSILDMLRRERVASMHSLDSLIEDCGCDGCDEDKSGLLDLYIDVCKLLSPREKIVLAHILSGGKLKYLTLSTASCSRIRRSIRIKLKDYLEKEK